MYSISHSLVSSTQAAHHFDPLYLLCHPRQLPPKLPLQFCRSLNCVGSESEPYGISRVSVHLESRIRKTFHNSRSWSRAFKLQHILICRSFSSDPYDAFRVSTCTDDAVFGGRIRGAFFLPGCTPNMRVRTGAFNPGNGGGGSDGGRTFLNLAVAGFLTYLTITGRLNWLFDAIFSLWIFSAVLWWFAERTLIKGPCPNCGGEFQVFRFSLKDEHRLCPYCSQPFKLENKKFVRDEPQFSNQQRQGFKQPFEGFGGFGDFGGFSQQTSASSRKEKSTGVIVDIEAEVRDKD